MEKSTTTIGLPGRTPALQPAPQNTPASQPAAPSAAQPPAKPQTPPAAPQKSAPATAAAQPKVPAAPVIAFQKKPWEKSPSKKETKKAAAGTSVSCRLLEKEHQAAASATLLEGWGKMREMDTTDDDKNAEIAAAAFSAVKGEIIKDINAKTSPAKIFERFVSLAGEVISQKAFLEKITALIDDDKSGVTKEVKEAILKRKAKAKEVAAKRQADKAAAGKMPPAQNPNGEKK